MVLFQQYILLSPAKGKIPPCTPNVIYVAKIFISKNSLLLIMSWNYLTNLNIWTSCPFNVKKLHQLCFNNSQFWPLCFSRSLSILKDKVEQNEIHIPCLRKTYIEWTERQDFEFITTRNISFHCSIKIGCRTSAYIFVTSQNILVINM
jgi:hypothetical protein